MELSLEIVKLMEQAPKRPSKAGWEWFLQQFKKDYPAPERHTSAYADACVAAIKATGGRIGRREQLLEPQTSAYLEWKEECEEYFLTTGWKIFWAKQMIAELKGA